MSNKDKILGVLKSTGSVICDDCLSKEADVHPRQTVYQVCSDLSKNGLIFRGDNTCSMCGKLKKSNRLNKEISSLESKSVSINMSQEHPWYWERNIQSVLVKHLITQGFSIRSVADTAARTQGKDIIAVGKDGRQLWVSVKGFSYSKKTANTQARHSFAEALFDLILYKDENPEVDLVLAFPDGYSTYLNLASRVSWLKTEMPFKIYWVGKTEEVRVQ